MRVEDELACYKHLDDYDYYKAARLKHNAEVKFGQIMQSIKEKYKNSSPMNCDAEIDSDISEEPTAEFFDFNQIIKRHKRRVKHNLNHHRHR